MQTSSFLPTIKCSDCSAEIEISRMGDHVCSNAAQRAPPSEPKPEYRVKNAHSAFPKPNIANGPTIFKGGRLPPPRIDPSTANRPFLGQAPPTPNSMSSVSPTMSSYSRRSNRRIPPRSATAPLPRGPPSPELSNLDCPFPPFPTSKSRSATPTRDLESKQSRSNHNEYVRMHAEPSPMYAPVSVRANGGGNVLQRMDTIAPGPFDVDSRDGQERSQGRGDGKQHKRTATVTSKDFSRPLSAGSVRSNFLRLSTVGAGNSQKPSLASISGGPRSMLDGEQQTPSFENLRGGPVRQDGHDSGFHRENLQQDPPDQPLRLEKRSQTFPVNSQTRGQLGQHIGAGTLQPSDLPPALRVRRPTISAASTPSLPEPFVNGEQSNSRSLPGNARPEAHRHGTGIQNRSISRDEPKMQRRPTEPPPALISNLAKEFREGNSQHTPTESISSTGSYGSDAKSGSSRSSPPLSDASTRLHTKPFNFDHLGNGGTDIPLSMDSSHLKDSITSRSKEAPRSNVKPPQERPGELLPQPDPRLEPPESPMDPAMQSGRLSPFPPSINHVPLPAQPKQRDLVPPPIRRATTSNKGNCRGCGEVIKGKSVSSADGRLTGRYHKQCFVCKTCREPFQTADFYVINNHPYCERHYHQLNGSLCRACDRGIEGQYLATESKQKFHPNCFTCQDCRMILRDDYFEMSGKVYCERHAFKAAQQASFLGPGRRHPERRTTRLMMM